MPPKRAKGVTFKLVHPSYDDAEHEGAKNTAVMVEEQELRKHLPSTATRRRRQRGDESDEDESATVSDLAREWTTTTSFASSVPQGGTVRLPEEDAYMNKHNFLRAQDSDDADDTHGNLGEEDEEDEDKLFADQEEVEFTDDFLRELVFGDGGGDEEEDDTDGDGGAEIVTGHDESVYVQHDVTKRGVDRQFARMMREFDVDARLNDAYTDDPRAHGALEVDQYLRALEEFVVDRAGVDYGTAEPRRNKGLIHQLKNMVLSAGTEMGPSGELYTTTVLPDRQTRFMEEFQRETEEIRQAALHRMQWQKPDGPVENSAGEEGEVGTWPGETEAEDDEAYVLREVRDKANRLDCETVVSMYSTCFNQPNVIRAPATGRRRKRHGASTSSPSAAAGGGTKTTPTEEDEETVPELVTQPLAFERYKGETREEKKLRQQLAKQVQRERRGKKRELKEAYKNLEADEVKRSKESQAAKKTVHFF
ncbi:protein LTV1 [Trypanosoma rangeli]|uniref:Protein LTV1 n=1 Tax=Trypanosoma rangeli TaxID=5698 RepID=A0A3R7LZ80_TRYRA|nr:protein LTV1 [Trypanosoma rangeli]RNF06153.1 protein LTV1 [Trypanosoma rangeli]|eukprot:RNF06153.1 protein LTV1 [Trypanosoma rangeli]